MVSFIRSIGLNVETKKLDCKTFMPGIHVDKGVMYIDEDQLMYPGDILHEAGHMAIFTTARRNSITYDFAGNGGDEMAAIAWSYAAARHLDIDPSVVFHEHGYKGDSAWLLQTFNQGNYIGVPMLDWLGLTKDSARFAGDKDTYPQMLRWVVDDVECPR